MNGTECSVIGIDAFNPNSSREENAFSFEYLVTPSNYKVSQIDTCAIDDESAA